MYSPLSAQSQPHGKALVPPEDLQAVTSGKVFVSVVYFDLQTNKVSVDLSAPIATTSLQKVLGFICATLSMDDIWTIVMSDGGANGKGSFALMLDQNGVRIADAVASQLLQP